MRKLIAVLLCAVVLAPVAEARGKKTTTEPGKYKAWGDDIDEIEIVKSWKTSDYDNIVVAPFDTSGAVLPEGKENEARQVLASFTDTLTEAFRTELKAKAKVEQSAKPGKTARTLVLRGKVEGIDPGSRAKRYFGGFGAGSAGTKVTGELVDAKSGAVLVTFTQERRSGGTWKVAGGNDVTVMRDSIHALGQDIAHIVDAFQ
jgi:hypothetical protein